MDRRVMAVLKCLMGKPAVGEGEIKAVVFERLQEVVE